MKLEDKFIEVLTQAREPYIMYLQSPKDGYIKLEYRKKWNDGLSTTSNIRIINPKLGISTAPTSWTHLLKSLEVNGINEDEFNRVLDRRIDMQIVQMKLFLPSKLHSVSCGQQSSTRFSYSQHV